MKTGLRGLPGALIAITVMGLQSVPVGAQDTVTVVAGPEYEAGSLQRALLGSGYRDLWTAPVRAPVLDLGRFGGGLTPVQRGGGVQTTSLRFEAPDGREYNFRSVNKDYSESMPDWARGTIVEWLRKDQTAAQHPGAVLVATPLLESVGILHPGPQLVVMPDDPRLGEFREDFAGLLGTIELHANEGEDNEPLFAGSPTIAGGDRVLEHLEEEPEHRVDGAAVLAERLMSIYLGDWDRHIDQYRFARYERDGVYWWVPIPEDRDYAFVNHDGLLLAIARKALTARLIRFRDRYPSMEGMLSNSADLSRRLLSDVDRATWDSVAHVLHARLTDDAIDAAVAAQPDAWRDRTAAGLAETLRARRDRFLAMSDDFYRLMAESVEVYGTEEDEAATVDRHPDGSLTVRLASPGNEGWGDQPYYERRFDPAETREVRIHLEDGDDRAVVRGSGPAAIKVRIVGGDDDDVLVDSAGTGVVFYDAEGDNRIVAGPGTRVDRRPYEPPEEGFSILPNSPRDWGRDQSPFSPVVGWEPDVGLVVGGGPMWTRYGFRHHPYASRHRVAAVVAPGAWRGAAYYNGDFRPESSPSRIDVRVGLSNMERARFHGFGNTSPELPNDSALTWYRRAEAGVNWRRPWTDALEVRLGTLVRYSDPELEAGSALERIRPFGAGSLVEAGARAALTLDTRDSPAFPRRGVHATADLAAFLPLAEGDGPFVTTGGRASALVPLPVPAILALGVGGEYLVGTAPVHAMPRLGGRADLRGFSHDRFTGDALAHATGELRVPLFPAKLIARGTVGVSALADAGRVWVDGASDGDWHSAVGGALWFTTTPATVALEWARGEKDGLYLRFGMGL